MKRKEVIKQIQEGKIQVFNDLLPSTKEIKKFLKEAFPEDDYLEKYPNEVDEISRKYFKKAPYDENFWVSNNGCKKSLPIINLSIITKRKKTKLKQLEKQFSDLAKNVSELRQSLAKDVEVDVEEVKSELIVGEWYKSTLNSCLACIISIKSIDFFAYGFSKEGLWINTKEHWTNSHSNWTKATPQEVQTALENEAKKRGLIDGGYILDCNNVKIKPVGNFVFYNDTLHYGGATLFKDGKFAELIQQETIKEEEIDFSVPQFLVHEDGQVLLSTGLCENNMFEATVIISSVAYKKGDKTMFRQDVFKPFKGELTIK